MVTALYLAILSCEIAFWIALALGLVARYVWKRPALGQGLLLSLPIIDLALIAFTILDLRSGTMASFAHDLAAAYIGFTIGFGALVVRWADQHVAHRFAGAPAPPAPPQTGLQSLIYDLKLWLRCIMAWAVTLGLISLMIGLVGDSAATMALKLWFRIALGGVVLWFIAGPLWSLLFRSWRRSPRPWPSERD